ncbi:MAG: FemAB family XrtA/PEP-CTERM system-associated protein [Erythrobacter sp.]|jgi:FemAB-related protein (PEP-CTERM system-associated)
MNAPLRHVPAVRQADLRDPREVARIEAFVAGHGGDVFQRPLWLSAVEKGTGNPAMGLMLERGGLLAGWLPLSRVHSPLFGCALVSSGFGVGGGVLAERSSDAATLCRAAEELARRLSASTIELRSASAPDDWQRIEGRHANFAADLAGDDEQQLLAIPRKARAEVRKGLDLPLAVTVGTSPADRKAHYAAYAESVRNLGTPVFPRGLFDAVLDGFGEDADILTVSHAGRPVASVLSLYHCGTVMPYWGGGTFAARGLRANERMYYELMLHARRKGCTRFDFGRSKTGSGPFAFKKNWGFAPQPLVYRSWTAPGVAARNIDPADQGYSAGIALWKKLPLPVANRIGPWIARGLG